MLKNNFKNEKIILIFSAIYRIIIFFFSNNSELFKEKLNFYTEMLNLNFLPFISYEHTKPSLFFIKDFIAFRILPYNYSLVNFTLISILDTISALIYYRLILKISNSLKFSLFSAILLSIGFVTWEYWREASHFDHLNIFLFAILLHSLFLVSSTKKLIVFIYYSISLIFITSFHSFGLIFALLSIIINFANLKKKKIFILLSIVLSLYLILVSSNIKRFNIPLLSTVGGQNQLQFLWNSSKAEKAIMQELTNSTKYPDWYKNCFLEAKDEGGKYGSIYGKCFADPIKSPNEAKQYLESVYIKYEDKKLNSYIEKDLKLIDSPFHFRGGVNESKLGFHVYYGQYSGKLARKVIINNPLIILNSLLRSIYSGISGSLFFTGLYYEPHLIKLPLLHKISNFFISIFIFWGFILSIINVLLISKKSFLNPYKTYKYSPFESKNQNLKFLTLNTSFFTILNFFLFSISTCCENSRMMVGVLPYAMLTTIAFLVVMKKIRNSHLKLPTN